MTSPFIIDTSVISETSKKRPNLDVIRFLQEAEEIYLSCGSLLELQMGIQKVSWSDPQKAVKLSHWYHGLINGGITIIPTDQDVVSKWAVLASDPKMHNLMARRDITSKPRGGQDLHIAAAALAWGMPIATFNVKDFMLINEHYPLPGVYDPGIDVWYARTSLGPEAPANVNEPRRQLRNLVSRI